MIDKRKVRLMTRTSMYEQHNGNTDFAMAKYLKMDYVGLHLWTTGIAVTLAYFLILLLVASYNFEYIIANLTTINYPLLITILVVAYLGMLALFLLIAFFVFSYRYDQSEEGLKRYFSRLRKIYKMNKENGKRKG